MSKFDEFVLIVLDSWSFSLLFLGFRLTFIQYFLSVSHFCAIVRLLVLIEGRIVWVMLLYTLGFFAMRTSTGASLNYESFVPHSLLVALVHFSQFAQFFNRSVPYTVLPLMQSVLLIETWS